MLNLFLVLNRKYGAKSRNSINNFLTQNLYKPELPRIFPTCKNISGCVQIVTFANVFSFPGATHLRLNIVLSSIFTNICLNYLDSAFNMKT